MAVHLLVIELLMIVFEKCFWNLLEAAYSPLCFIFSYILGERNQKYRELKKREESMDGKFPVSLQQTMLQCWV